MNANAPCNKWAGGAGSKPCPRCGTTISSNKATCFGCSTLPVAVEPTPVACSGGDGSITVSIDPRIVYIEAQIAACKRGWSKVIECPFCKAQNKAENEALCCADLGAVVLAILRKEAQQECLDTAARIAEHVAKN